MKMQKSIASQNSIASQKSQKSQKLLKYIKRKFTQLLCRLKTGSLIRDYPVLEELDEWFIEQMNKGEKPKIIDDYIVEFGGRRVWIENKYYASPTLYGESKKINWLPHMDTTCRFFKLVEEENKRDDISIIKKSRM